MDLYINLFKYHMSLPHFNIINLQAKVLIVVSEQKGLIITQALILLTYLSEMLLNVLSK